MPENNRTRVFPFWAVGSLPHYERIRSDRSLSNQGRKQRWVHHPKTIDQRETRDKKSICQTNFRFTVIAKPLWNMRGGELTSKRHFLVFPTDNLGGNQQSWTRLADLQLESKPEGPPIFGSAFATPESRASKTTSLRRWSFKSGSRVQRLQILVLLLAEFHIWFSPTLRPLEFTINFI